MPDEAEKESFECSLRTLEKFQRPKLAVDGNVTMRICDSPLNIMLTKWSVEELIAWCLFSIRPNEVKQVC
jgi:hypothetical protein